MNRKQAAAMVAAWLLIGGAGLLAMLCYERAPGEAGEPPAAWPAESALAPRGATLLMFAHPHCPCTRASLGELARIMAQGRGRVAAQVFFVRPAGAADDWVQTDLWRTAQAIPGVEVHIDRGGAEARLFHAGTSGQTMLYDHGRLLFAGGITSGRGHEGDNPGRDAIMEILAGRETGQAGTAVFGCPLSEKLCRRDEP